MTGPTEWDPLISNTSSPQTPLVSRPTSDTNKGLQPAARLGPRGIKRSTRYGILAGIWISTFLTCVNMTLVPTMLPSISSDFNQSNQASWLGTAYLLATCTFTPLYGRLCNVMGRRGANQLAVSLCAVGTIACGFSNSMEMLILARFFSGLGGGGMITTAQIITSDMYSLRSRGLAQGVASLFNGLGLGLGGPLGGLVTDWLGWRWAFLLQIPLFVLSLTLTTLNLDYVTPGKGKSAREVLKRIDYGGAATLLGAVGLCLVFLSTRYNEGRPWTDPMVVVPLILSVISTIIFVLVELLIAPEPVLAPFLLRQKVPILVGLSNFLVALCNFSITYFFPMWFQTVMLTSASTAGLHLLPNSLSMSMGAVFAGWVMHRTGKYKLINLIFGVFPFIATVLITLMREDSSPLQLWCSIIPLGFGNGVVLQTTLIALLAHLPESHMAVGTGFGTLFRGIGQVGGVAISSAIFQSMLSSELRKRIDIPGAEDMIDKLRHSARLVADLPPDLQQKAKDSYAVSLRAVFILAACSSFLAFVVRLPIPDKHLERHALGKSNANTPSDSRAPSPIRESPEERDDDSGDGDRALDRHRKRPRRLSTYESAEGVMDLESEAIGGSAR